MGCIDLCPGRDHSPSVPFSLHIGCGKQVIKKNKNLCLFFLIILFTYDCAGSCCVRFSLVVASGGYFLVGGGQVSHCGGLSCGIWALGCLSFSSCGAWA